MRNSCIYILFTIIIIQWMFINHLIHRLQRKNNIMYQVQGMTMLESSISNEIMTTDKLFFDANGILAHNSTYSNRSKFHVGAGNVAKENTGRSHYDGVAVTLMLNAPKWFQKRYSTMISNIISNTPTTWAIQIFYIDDPKSQSVLGMNINPNLARLKLNHDRIIFTALPNDLVFKFGSRKKLLYWTNEWVWQNVVAENVLVFTGNSVICSNGRISLLDGSANRALFDHVDYVGAPWINMFGEGGDAGAISFRKRSAMIDAIKFKPYETKDGRDDSYFIKTLKALNTKNEELGTKKRYNIATKDQTNIFGGNLHNFSSANLGPPPLPMVVSGTMANLNHDVRQDILNSCPELGMIFPLLHHPSCFGANPDGEECGKHICALKPASERSTHGC